MESRKIEYAPDYNSDLDRRATRSIKRLAGRGVIGAQQMLNAHESNTERQRLERGVIEAAKARRAATLALKKFWEEQNENAPHAAMEIYELAGNDVLAIATFDVAVDALNKFESEHAGVEGVHE